jgi:hypothetical protein
VRRRLAHTSLQFLTGYLLNPFHFCLLSRYLFSLCFLLEILPLLSSPPPTLHPIPSSSHARRLVIPKFFFSKSLPTHGFCLLACGIFALAYSRVWVGLRLRSSWLESEALAGLAACPNSIGRGPARRFLPLLPFFRSFIHRPSLCLPPGSPSRCCRIQASFSPRARE